MALTERDLQAVKDLLLEPILARMDSLEATVRSENDRRRNDVADLYERDRARAKETAELTGRVVSLEGWRDGHEKAGESAVQAAQWTKGQKVAVGAVALTAVVWIIDKAGVLVAWVTGKGGN